MLPDYGLCLKREGYHSSIVLDFVDWRIDNITVMGPGRFTTFAGYDFAGERHAVSLDFGSEQLAQILAKASSAVRRLIEREIRRDPLSIRTIELPAAIQCGIRARLGEETQGRDDSFVPLVIDKVD